MADLVMRYSDPPKICQQCGGVFYRANNVTSRAQWLGRKFCSNDCGHQHIRDNRPTLAEVFERQTIPEPNSGCLIWIGAVINTGYGVLTIDRRFVLAHRAAFKLHYGEFDESLDVLHRCDLPPCCEPNHLFLGDAATNGQDMATKFRSSGKLTREQVLAIRSSKELLREIAAQHNISISAVSHARRRETYVGVK